MSDSLESEIVSKSIDMALLGKNISGCLFHSDRGRQYTSALVRKKLL